MSATPAARKNVEPACAEPSKKSAAPAAETASDLPAQLLRAGMLKPKLKIGAADDPEEAAADRMADAVVNGGACCPACAAGAPKDEMRLKPEPGAPAAAPRRAASMQAEAAALSLSGGEPLPARLKGLFEPGFGRNFNAVRLHAGASAHRAARAIGARAFALGDNIGFAEGQYQPETMEGRRLVAHELAHVAFGHAGARRSALDPSREATWDWYDNDRHRDASFVQTVDRSSGDAAALAKDLKDAPAPANDGEREATEAKIRTLIRLNAVTMVGAHRKELLDRKQKFEAMLAPSKPDAEGSGGVSEADRRVDTAKTIRTAAKSVTSLNVLRDQLESLRDRIKSAVRVNAGAETIHDEFAVLQKSAYPDPPRDLDEHIAATREQMKGVSWGTKKVRLIELGHYLATVRQNQIDAVNLALAQFYDDFPFLADLTPEKIATGHDWSKTTRRIVAGGLAGLIAPVLGTFAAPLLAGKDKELDDDTLLAETRASFDRLVSRTDDAIVEVGSGSINPLDLPGAVAATRSALPATLQSELDRMKQDHEVFKFAVDMALALGIAVLAGLTGGAAAVGAAGWAAAAGAGAATLGAAQLAIQAKDMLSRQKLGAAATDPQGELLGVSAPGALEKVLFAVGVILTAVDLAGVVQEIRAARPRFAEEPHFKPAEEPKPSEPGAKLTDSTKIPQEPQQATQFVNEHPEAIVDNTPGRRRAELGRHEVVEVPDATGFHCEFHSAGGPKIPCPNGWGEPNVKGVAGQIHGADQYRGGQTVLTAKLQLPNGDIEYVAVPNSSAGWRDLQEDVAKDLGFKTLAPSTPGSDLHAEENLQAYIESIEKQAGGKVKVLEWAVSRGKGGTSVICKNATCRLISSKWGPQVK